MRKTTATDVIAKLNDEDAALTDEDPTEERTVRFRTPGFSRMRMEWAPMDRPIKDRALAMVEDRLVQEFSDAFQIMHDLFLLVRDPVVDANGEARLDRHGFPVWRKTDSGTWVEDFTKLRRVDQENFLFQITTRMFLWEQKAADAWGEAMFSKAMWEERMALGYDAPMSGTIEDRTAAGRIASADERYFALFLSLYSRKVDALVRSLALLAQRLKDVYSAV